MPKPTSSLKNGNPRFFNNSGVTLKVRGLALGVIGIAGHWTDSEFTALCFTRIHLMLFSFNGEAAGVGDTVFAYACGSPLNEMQLTTRSKNANRTHQAASAGSV